MQIRYVDVERWIWTERDLLRKGYGLVAALLLVVAVIYGVNFFYVGRPVSRALGEDYRNTGIQLNARLGYWVNPKVLVLDLAEIPDQKAPVDLWRALMQSAGVLADHDRVFTEVVLARSRRPVFQLAGDSFEDLGREFAAGQNPVYLLRTLPEKLFLPSGDPAYGTWTGGLLGVTGKQMEDLSDAALSWIIPAG